MGSFSLAFTLFPQNDQVCPLRRPHLCLGLFGVLLPRTLPTQTCNHNHNYTSTPQKVPKEGSQTRTLPLQVYNYNHNYNYTSTLQTVPKEGTKPEPYPYKSTTTTTTTTTPAPYKQYQKREAKPEPYPYKSTTTTTTTTTP